MTDDFFRSRLDQMIDLKHPLVVLGQRLPWSQIEAALAESFRRKEAQGQRLADADLFGEPIELVAPAKFISGKGHFDSRNEVRGWSVNGMRLLTQRRP